MLNKHSNKHCCLATLHQTGLAPTAAEEKKVLGVGGGKDEIKAWKRSEVGGQRHAAAAIPHSHLITPGEESKCQDKSRNIFNTFETMSQRTWSHAAHAEAPAETLNL